MTLHDAQGEALHIIRYGCMPDGDILGMRDRVVLDVATLLTKRPLDVVLLCDGAPEMWGLLDAWFTAERFPRIPIHRLVDLHHLLEKQGAAARVLDGPAGATARLQHWRLALLNRRSAATDILHDLVASGADEGPVRTTRCMRRSPTCRATARRRSACTTPPLVGAGCRSAAGPWRRRARVCLRCASSAVAPAGRRRVASTSFNSAHSP